VNQYIKIIISVTLFFVETHATKCTNAFNNVDNRVKDFLRIDAHIAEYHSSCNVIYAYSIFLDKPSEMDELEKDNVYAEQLGLLVKDYPKISKLIMDKSSFTFFNNFDNFDKIKFNNILKKSFSSKELKNSKNIAYLILALKINKNKIDEKKLIYLIRQLKNNYTLNELSKVDLFWTTYSEKYKETINNSKKSFIYFNQTLETYGLSILDKYLVYANDFYPVLLPVHTENKEYQSIIKALLKRIKKHKFEEQAYFLKNISLDIELALENGSSKREIVNYFDTFIKKDFIAHYGNLTCHEKEGVALLISDNLNSKLKWIDEDKSFFRKITRQLVHKEKSEILNILALFTINSTLYTQMDTIKKKKIFNAILKLPLTDKPTSSLALLHTLSNSTQYFSEVINNTEDIYKHDKYKEIFYVSRNGTMILNLYTEGDKKFLSEINDLVNIPYSEIHDLTNKEIMENTMDMVDYASYATLIIPGVGVGTQVFKELGKASMKSLLKQGVMTSGKKSLTFLKNQGRDMLMDKVRYSNNKRKNHYINQKTAQLDNGFYVTNIARNWMVTAEEQKELCIEGKK
jgi:hypothetical protein